MRRRAFRDLFRVGEVEIFVDAQQQEVRKRLHFVGLLCDAGILRRRKDGMHVFYAIADPMVFELCTLVCSRLQEDLARKVTHLKGS